MARMKSPASAQIGWRMVPCILFTPVGIDVDHDLAGRTGEAFRSVTRDDAIEPAAD